ncbi:MAG TPA: GDYXXLXY domain-containing protein [Ignavibacteria bacterium]|nr:GDYXXLXY domain-containing protein [Ignavibacteria bacterium]
MKQYKGIIILLNLILLLVIFNSSLVEKEEILSEGKLVLLKLAPVDPRSLMQGDYMALRYEVANDIAVNEAPVRGYCVLMADANNVAASVRFQKDPTPIDEDEILIKYRLVNGQLYIGAESYFFEEGQGKKFEEAVYGGLKIDEEGNSILIGLYDKEKSLIK